MRAVRVAVTLALAGCVAIVLGVALFSPRTAVVVGGVIVVIIAAVAIELPDDNEGEDK